MQRTTPLCFSCLILLLWIACVRAGYLGDNLPSKHCLARPGRSWVLQEGDRRLAELVLVISMAEEMYLEIDAKIRGDRMTPENWVAFEDIGRRIVDACEMLPLHTEGPGTFPSPYSASEELLRVAVMDFFQFIRDHEFYLFEVEPN